MYEPFLKIYKTSSQVENSPATELFNKIEPYADGFSSLMSGYGGTTFNNGLYRLHAAQDILKWTRLVEETFTDYKDRIICFGYDWLGRHFALDKSRVEKDQMLVLLLEPGTAEVMQIPANYSAFHNDELVHYQNEALASEFYSDWIHSSGEIPSNNQCIGYKVPLFLNGSDTIDNLELSDMEVYWSICGQIFNGDD
ncbi:MAG: DUF1851 domain-containing protein [Gammaproteobacteria bacterium]|nr:DUF1851 domain-containing protein [Gammaproteobacteria bacterium]